MYIRRLYNIYMIKSFILIMFLLSISLIYSTEVRLKTQFQYNAPPRYFVEGEIDKGVCIDIINVLNTRMMGDFRIYNPGNRHIPVSRIFNTIKNNEIDIWVGSAKTDERQLAGIKFSIPLYNLKGAFAKRSDFNFKFINAASLQGVRVGVLRGSRSIETMRSFSGVEILEFNTMEQALKGVASGRIDLAYYHDMGLKWQIKYYEFRDKLTLAELSISIESAPHYIMFSPSVSDDIISYYNRFIDEMINDGTMQEILDKYR